LPRQVWLLLNMPAFAGHTTGHADFPHPALGQDLTPSFACDAIGSFWTSCGVDRFPNLHVLRYVLHLSWTEVPSLHQSYPVSAVLRTSPPPQSARPVPHGRPVDRVIADL